MSTENNQNTPPAGTPPAANPPASNPPPADWTSGLSEELRGFAQTKEFKDPGTVLESYRNLEKLTGGGLDKLLKIPEKADAPEWNDIYGKLGRPSKPEDYKIPVSDGDKGEFAKVAANWFHEAGLSQRQAEKVAAKWNEFQAGQGKGQAEAMAAKSVAEEAALKTKWGSAYEQNLGVAQQAAKKFGVDEATIDAMEAKLGFAKTMEFFQGIGAGLGEHNFVSGDKGGQAFGGAMTPAQAQAHISELKSDKGFIQRYAAGDSEAKKQMTRLMQFAYPGDTIM